MEKPKLKLKVKIAKCNKCGSLNAIRKLWRNWDKIEKEMRCGKCGGKMRFISQKEFKKEMKK